MILSRRGLSASIAVLALFGVARAEAPTPEAPLKVTYATYLNPSVVFVQVDDWFMAEVTKRSGGAVTFETYYGGSLLGALDVFPGLGSGAADIAMGAPGYNLDMLPYTGVPQPFVTGKADAAMRALDELYRVEPALQEEWQRNNLELLYPMAAGENSFWLSKRVETAADLSGMRIRATLGIATALDELGATPVALPAMDAIEGLKRGAVDGIASLPFDTSMSLGLDEIAKYVCDCGRMGIYGIMAMAANKDWWDGLDPSVQTLFQEVAAEVPDKYLAIMEEQLNGMVDTLHGRETIEVVTQSDEEVAAWKAAAAEAVWTKWTGDMAARGLDGEAMLGRYRELVAKYEPESKYLTGLERYRAKYGD